MGVKHWEWPRCGEIDIMEHVGNKPNGFIFTPHAPKADWHQGKWLDCKNALDDFHIYELDWTKDAITWTFDGKVAHVYKNDGQGGPTWAFDTPEYLIINLAIGGGMGGRIKPEDYPREFLTDYVRIYQKDTDWNSSKGKFKGPQ
jgi:beta-glucanase (GH16 family)